MSYDVLQFGTLYLDGRPVSPSIDSLFFSDLDAYNGPASIEFGNTEDGKAITWIKPSNSDILVADRPLLKTISYTDLMTNHLVGGREVVIDGRRYTCRLPSVGQNEKDKNNEWDSIIKAVGDGHANGVLHINGMLLIGKEVDGKGFCAVRGRGKDFRGWDTIPPHEAEKYITYRPILIPQYSTGIVPGKDVCLDGQPFHLMQLAGLKELAFFPVLCPMTKSGKKFDLSVFAASKVKSGETVHMYTLLQDGIPVRQDLDTPEKYKEGAAIAITDEYFGDEYLISWCISHRTAYASKSILSGITPTELKRQGFI